MAGKVFLRLHSGRKLQPVSHLAYHREFPPCKPPRGPAARPRFHQLPMGRLPHLVYPHDQKNPPLPVKHHPYLAQLNLHPWILYGTLHQGNSLPGSLCRRLLKSQPESQSRRLLNSNPGSQCHHLLKSPPESLFPSPGINQPKHWILLLR